MVAVLGETGIRIGEALALKWDNVSFPERMLTVARTKNRRIRHVPLSDYAIQWMRRLVRYVQTPYLFISSRSKRPWVNPEKAFKRGAQAAELEWVGFHDLRRFRATQWLKEGVDVRTVKDLLGHREIQTTMRYALFVSDHAVRSVRQAQATEARRFEQRVKNG